MAVPLTLVLAAALSGCGDDDVSAISTSSATATPTVSVSAGTPPPSATSRPAATEDASPSAAPASAAPAATTTAPADAGAASGGPDLDGDGRSDSVQLRSVEGVGWSFDVTLADGRMTSAPLHADLAVAEDVAVTGAVDLDRDGRDEVLVRTLRALGGENAAVFRLDGAGIWLVRTAEDAPWELSTAGGMSGPRSYDCTAAGVRTRESTREGSAGAAPTYATTTRTWRLGGRAAQLVDEEQASGVSADAVPLDATTCG